jgi:hypothetical protein
MKCGKTRPCTYARKANWQVEPNLNLQSNAESNQFVNLYLQANDNPNQFEMLNLQANDESIQILALHRHS